MISRREFLLQAAATTGISASSLGGSTYDVTEDLEITEVTIGIPEIAPEFVGYKFVFISDIHYGQTLSESMLEKTLSAVQRFRPDLLLLGGDYIYVPQAWFSKLDLFARNQKFVGLGPFQAASAIFYGLGRALRELSVPDGVVGVFGNHDRWYHTTACAEMFRRMGFTLLVDQSHQVRREDASLEIFGSDDFLTGTPQKLSTPPSSLGNIQILLAHNPDFIAYLIRTGSPLPFHLALCGHTHGGQIALPLLGPLHYNVYERALASGLTRIDNRYVYTSKGIGTVEIPVRILVKPEVVLCTLTHGSSFDYRIKSDS
jgi:uncharacterized protein